MTDLINAYIEIEQFSNIKYEYDKVMKELVVDRILPYPYYYPYAYGFIPHTLAEDDDDLDVLIITDKNIEKNKYYNIHIIGVLIMEDEKGLDEKVLSILADDKTDNINDISDISDEIKENINWFFSNYKSKSPGKWSKVSGFKNREFALELYKKYNKKYTLKKILKN